MPKKQGFLLSRARVQQSKHKKATLDDVCSFFQQMATLLNAGTPLLSALRLCAEQSESVRFSAIAKEMAGRVAGGNSLFKAASEHPEVFEIQWLYMIRTAEVSGRINQVMVQLNNDIQRARANRGKIVSALIYPAILLCVAVASLVIMLFKVVPTFAEFFTDFGGRLPAITQFVINLSNALQTKGPYIFVGMLVAGYAFRRYARTDSGNRTLRALMLALPVTSALYVESAMEKFGSTLGLLLESGSPLLEAIRTTQEVFRGDPIYSDALTVVYNSVARGNPLAPSMDTTKLFTAMVINMIKVGEESGKLPGVLNEISKFYAGRVEVSVHRLTSMLEPVIVIGMGVLVGGILASIYIPMFQLAGGGGGG
jgi:type IV pilus assembly protein PilC